MRLLKKNVLFFTLLFAAISTVFLPSSCSSADNENPQIEYLIDYGTQAFEKKDIPAALTTFENLLKIYKERQDVPNIAATLSKIGWIYYSTGRNNEAGKFYNEAFIIYQELNDKPNIAACLERMALTFYNLDNYKKALECHEKSLKIYSEIGDRYHEALTQGTIGMTYYRIGESQKALVSLSKALEVFKEIGNQEGIASTLEGISAAYAALGEPKKAMQYSKEAVRISKKNGFTLATVMNLINSADLHEEAADYPKTISCLEEAFNLLKETGKENIGPLLLSIGTVYFKMGDKNKALVYYSEALKIDRETGIKSQVADDLTGMGVVYGDSGNILDALIYFSESLKINREIGYKEGVAGNLSNIALCYYMSEKYEKALEYFQEALQIDKELNNKKGVALLTGNIALSCHLVNIKSCPNALPYATESLKLALDINDQMQIWRSQFILASIYSKQNNLFLALEHYKSAIETLESVRGKLKLEEYKLSFVEDKMAVYENIVLLLLKLNRKDEAFDYVERAKSRALLDLLANRIRPKKATKELSQEEMELQNKINALLERIEKESSRPTEQQSRAAITQTSQELEKLRSHYQEVLNNIRQKDPEFASIISVNPLKSKEVQQLLDKDTTLLEYFVTEDKLIIWILSNTKLEVIEVPVKEKDLTSKVFSLRQAITEQNSDYKQACQEFYKLLIQPAKPYIAGSKLYIVPHKALHYLPYACLMDKDKFLIEEYSLAYSPNASMLKFCFEKRKQGQANLLAFGNPDNSLKYAEEEVDVIKKGFSQSEVFIKGDATENKAKTLANNYQILHFACHGELNPISPLYSNLRLAKDNQEDGRLEVWEIYDLDLKQASLVTLSACQTALGNITSGDEIIGLTRGFLYAGSPSILASLWNVDDKSTSLLMQDFYTNLKGNSKAEALRLAQLKLIKEKQKSNPKERGLKTIKDQTQTDSAHPFYWAGFVLIGDWN